MTLWCCVERNPEINIVQKTWETGTMQFEQIKAKLEIK